MNVKDSWSCLSIFDKGNLTHVFISGRFSDRVVEGIDIISKVEKVETGANDKPVEDVVIVDCGAMPADYKPPPKAP